jgi:hypothetical protein
MEECLSPGPHRLEDERYEPGYRGPRGRRLRNPAGDLHRVQADEGEDHRQDHQQDEVGLLEVAAFEPLVPAELAEEDGHLYSDDHQHGQDVLAQAEPAGSSDERDGEPWPEHDLPEGFHDRGEQDDEPPEDEGVHEPRAETLQELPLPQDHRGLELHPLGEVLQSTLGATEANQAVEEVGPLEEQAPGHGQQETEQGDPHHEGSLRGPSRSAQIPTAR